jgi:hypothetical protein
MGEKPPKMTIERIDPTLGYSPENCRWATAKEQANNKTTTLWLTHEGQTKSLANWCEELGLPYPAIHARLQRGWSAGDALTQPIRTTSETSRQPVDL